MKRALVLLGLTLLSTGCSKGKGAEEKGNASRTEAKAQPGKEEQKLDGDAHADEPKHEELPKRVRLSKEVITDAKVKTTPVVKELLAPTMVLPGELVSDPDKTARVSTPAAGRLVAISFREGSNVKKGDVLGAVRVTDVGKVRAAHSAAVAKGAAARANADRLQGLADKGLAAKQEALAARAEADALDAEARGLGEELGVLGLGANGTGSEIALRAPVGGVIVSRDAVVGQPVTAEQTVGTIADLSEVWFLARVFEKDLGRLNVGANAEVVLNAYPKERFAGVVEYIGKQLDPIARTLTARIRLTNRKDLLRLGLFGSARVAVAEESKKGPVLVVPQNAVTEIGGKTVVFIWHEDDDFELHEVLLGDAAVGKAEVVSGLREGEQVVYDGVFTLKSAVLKSTLAEQD
jgi:cobalt-zinc-cadmium efflux system membrane fusion protein